METANRGRGFQGEISVADQAGPGQRSAEAAVKQRIGILREQRLQMLLLEDDGVHRRLIEMGPGHPFRGGGQDPVGLEVQGDRVRPQAEESALIRRRFIVRVVLCAPQFHGRAHRGGLAQSPLYAQHRMIRVRPYSHYIRAAADLYRGIFQPDGLFEIRRIGERIRRQPDANTAKLQRLVQFTPGVRL